MRERKRERESKQTESQRKEDREKKTSLDIFSLPTFAASQEMRPSWFIKTTLPPIFFPIQNICKSKASEKEKQKQTVGGGRHTSLLVSTPPHGGEKEKKSLNSGPFCWIKHVSIMKRLAKTPRDNFSLFTNVRDKNLSRTGKAEKGCQLLSQ